MAFLPQVLFFLQVTDNLPIQLIDEEFRKGQEVDETDQAFLSDHGC